MNKWFGKVGYAITEETRPGVWMADKIVERDYYGDIVRNIQRFGNEEKTNEDITVSVNISIVADPFAYNHFHTIKYIEYMGTKWDVSSVDPQYPRLILTLGGVYNGDEPSDSSD